MLDTKNYENRNIEESQYPTCKAKRCLYRKVNIGGELCTMPVLRRHTHKMCELCNYESTSTYTMHTCPRCATKESFPEEFAYYHRSCN